MARAGDEEILRLLREAEASEAALVEAIEEDAPDEPAGDPCPACGEPAERLDVCHVCHEEGCMPPDLWSPGMADACLTLCVRCARPIHLACSVEDAAGNPRCPTCHF